MAHFVVISESGDCPLDNRQTSHVARLTSHSWMVDFPGTLTQLVASCPPRAGIAVIEVADLSVRN